MILSIQLRKLSFGEQKYGLGDFISLDAALTLLQTASWTVILPSIL